MAFELPKLAYAYDALEPHIDAKTLEIHHGKHHKAYVDKTNGMLAAAGLEDASLLEVIKKAKDKGDKKLFNNAAQIWNHSFFWQCLAPAGSTGISGELKTMVERDFGSTDAMLEKLATESADHFASGWGWLVLRDGKLAIETTANQDTPISTGGTPILGVDVWEHAYYLNYQNRRPDYIEAFFNVINWTEVARLYATEK